MEEIKEGEYVRTKYGDIDKVIENWKDIKGQPFIYHDYRGEKNYCDEEDILKHSPNIIDLIEVGDYVNGYKVEKVENGNIYVDYCWECSLYTMVTDKAENIRTILTKESYKANCYEVK